MAKKGRAINKSDLSRKRRRKRKGKFYFLIGMLIFVLGGVVVVARLPAFQIKEIKVSETKRIQASVLSQIAEGELEGNYLYIFPRRNFMLYPKKLIGDKISKELPAVLELEVRTEIDRNLYIEVKERLASALWCRSVGDCYYLDKAGIVFARAMNNEGLLEYYGIVKPGAQGSVLGESYGTPEFFQELVDFISDVSELGFNVLSAEVVSTGKAELNLKDGSHILFLPYEGKKDELFVNLELFVNNLKANNNNELPALEYIDARYGNKIFYKLKEGV